MMLHGAREREALQGFFAVRAFCGVFFDPWAAGPRQAEQLGGFVETFARGIVKGCSPTAVKADIFGDENLCVATGDEKNQIWKLNVVGQARGEGVAFEMVDGEERDFQGGCHRFSGHHADKYTPDQAGSAGGGDGVQIVHFNFCLLQGYADDAVEVVEMRTGGYFGDDSAIEGVFFELTQHYVREYLSFICYDGCGGFVTAGFDAQYDHKTQK